MFQQFSNPDPSRSNTRLLLACAGAMVMYLLVGLVLGQLLAARALSLEKEVEVTFIKPPPAPPPPPKALPLPPPPPPPPPVQKPKLPPPKLVPKALVAPKEVPEQELPEADPSLERGMPDLPLEATDPAGVPGGSPGGTAEPPAPPPPPPPPPKAIVLPPGASPPERQNPEVVPEYPKAARSAGIEGEVVIKVIIHADGHVELVQIIKSDPSFDEAVREVIGKLRYKPAFYAGQPIAVFRNIRFPFKLKETPQ